MYSLLTRDAVEKTRAKGIKTQYVKKHLSHQDYVDCLTKGTQTTSRYLTFRSRKHVITTETVNKVALSSFDDKRYLLANSPDTLSYGHWRIGHAQLSTTYVRSLKDCAQCTCMASALFSRLLKE